MSKKMNLGNPILDIGFRQEFQVDSFKTRIYNLDALCDFLGYSRSGLIYKIEKQKDKNDYIVLFFANDVNKKYPKYFIVYPISKDRYVFVQLISIADVSNVKIKVL